MGTKGPMTLSNIKIMKQRQGMDQLKTISSKYKLQTKTACGFNFFDFQ